MNEIFDRYDQKVLELATVKQQLAVAIGVVRSLKEGSTSLDEVELVEGGFTRRPKEAI